MNKKNIRIRAPNDIMSELRTSYPGVRDSELIRLTYNTSLAKVDVGLGKKDFKDKLGKFIYGKTVWDKTK